MCKIASEKKIYILSGKKVQVCEEEKKLSGHYNLLLTPAEKVENLNSWHNFLFVVFTPQTSSCGPERWVGSTMKTMFHQRNCKRHR